MKRFHAYFPRHKTWISLDRAIRRDRCADSWSGYAFIKWVDGVGWIADVYCS